ncbi:hypothetical protein [Kitasatospora brasiliensis]|uniref:hypothetical protein n=1 Tax=Kitasatospora brasiliensis TaxID=3058040 RepID=UPI0029314347|nr:hypothetical protein [Kitasatospora sp. K002]
MIGPRGASPVPPTLHTCPSCGYADQVRSVPVVHQSGLSTETFRTYRDDHWRTETRVVASELTRALAPAPEIHPEVLPLVLGFLTFFGTLGIFVSAYTDSHRESYWSDSPPSSPEGLYLLSGIGLVVAIGLFALAVLLRLKANRQLAGRPHALHLWSQGWYCGRCGTVHFSPYAGQGAAALSLYEFRYRVWTAGGYGHLAHRY